MHTRTHPLRPAGLALLLLAATLAAPLAGADHIRVMAVYQAGTGPGANEITLFVDFSPTGNCCGGTFQWTTGETPSVSGALFDGFSSGNYQGDVTTVQTATLSDARPFSWTRVSIPPTSGTDPGVVRLRISYAYNAPGPYVISWQDCCVDSQGTAVVVAGGAAPVTRIAALDDVGSTQASQALEDAGFVSCSTLVGGGICFDLYTSATLASADLVRTPSGAADAGRYKVLYVAANLQTAGLAALAVRAQDISDFAALGGGVVVYAQDAGLTSGTRWGWLPNGASYSDAITSGEDIHLTTKGTTWVPGQPGRSHLNQVDATLSNWGPSRQNHFTSWPTYLGGPVASADALTVDASSGEAISLGGAYSGRGCVFVSGQLVDIEANSMASSGTGISTKEAAQMLFRSSLNYALEC